MFILMATFVVMGLLLAGISLPLIQKRIPPNPWYGFRVRKTLSSPEIWYPANVYMAKYLLGWGITIAIVSFLFYFIPGIGLDTYVALCTFVALGGMVIVMVKGFRYLKTL
jgi:hypothetical protein